MIEERGRRRDSLVGRVFRIPENQLYVTTLRPQIGQTLRKTTLRDHAVTTDPRKTTFRDHAVTTNPRKTTFRDHAVTTNLRKTTFRDHAVTTDPSQNNLP